ncbi:MAG: 4Fe-4S dicluster domain-containing protein [Candidatus Helarchaeota archaeon]|nr:4Fe-4S dicluster domain-containing protein [Candidatus Helarchaeota archaeon]
MTTDAVEQAYKKLRDILMMPKSKFSVDLLQIWYNEEDIQILTAGPFKTVFMDRYTIEEYAKKTGIPEEKVRESFNRCASRGVLFYYISRKDGKKKFMLYPLFPGILEYFLVNTNVSIDERRKLVKMLENNEQMTLNLFAQISDFTIFRVVPGLKPPANERLIEVDKTLQVDKTQILAYQDVEEIVREAGKIENNIAVLPCMCRTEAMMMKRSPECERTLDNCFVIGIPSKFIVEEGIGRYVSVEEALAILRQAEKEGLIHNTQNTVDKQGFICNCCPCCCGVFRLILKYHYWDILQKSDYIPVINNEKCKKCRICVDICPLYALMYHLGDAEDKSQDYISVREDICIGCGLCASNCPHGVINLQKVRDNEPATDFLDAVTKMMTGMKKK